MRCARDKTGRCCRQSARESRGHLSGDERRPGPLSMVQGEHLSNVSQQSPGTGRRLRCSWSEGRIGVTTAETLWQRNSIHDAGRTNTSVMYNSRNSGTGG